LYGGGGVLVMDELDTLHGGKSELVVVVLDDDGG
jgi:hypothetical protein